MLLWPCCSDWLSFVVTGVVIPTAFQRVDDESTFSGTLAVYVAKLADLRSKHENTIADTSDCWYGMYAYNGYS